MLQKVPGKLREKLMLEKVPGEVHGKLMLEKKCGEVHRKKMLEKVPGELHGKIMLENVPGKLREKLMLEKVRGENDVGKSAWGNCVENCRKSDRQSAVSRTQCYKPQAEKTTVLASVGHRNESCFTYFITHFSKITTCSVAFC